jgi:GTP-binding protein HflX
VDVVEAVLGELGAGDKPRVAVFNKMDRAEAQGLYPGLAARFPEAAAVSALTGEGLDRLRGELADALRKRNRRVRMMLPLAEGKLLAAIRSSGKVFAEKYLEEGFVLVEASVPARLYGRCVSFAADDPDAGRTEGA